MTVAASSDTDRSSIVGDYKHGSICRVKLYNFLTYANAEVRPGPRLNMVIGPNGSGKSTILCAICLGLGGEPSMLGRASDIETFVANGEEEGEIELEIFNTQGGRNPVIRRRIRRSQSPKSVFFWNDKQVSKKSVFETCLQKYQISVDNLCTFLPQDRVGSFSGFDAKALLVETEKSLSSSQHLYYTHMELIKDQDDMRGGDNQKGTLEDKLRQLEHESHRLERAKSLMEERNQAVADADLLKKKILWLRFDALIEELGAKKAAKAELRRNVLELQQVLKPKEERVHMAEQQVQHWIDQSSTYDKEVRGHQKQMEKQAQKYEHHDDEIEKLIQEIHALEAARATKLAARQQLVEKKEIYEANIAQFPPIEALKEEELQCRNDQKAILPRYDSSKREHMKLQESKREIEDEYRQIQAKMKRLQDEKARRRERIFRQQVNLKKVADWLQQNRTSFRKEVVGPIMCEVSTKSNDTAAYLEQHVPNSALKSFVVQCKEDYDFLYKRVRQDLKLPINIILVKEIESTNRLYSEQKMSILKNEHGVLGYMDETFTAPQIVVEALKNAAQIHKVLIGTEQTQKSLDDRNLLQFLVDPEAEFGNGRPQSCCIFSTDGQKSFKYTSVISKYSGKPSVRVDDIRPAKFLAPGVSEESKQRVQEELKVITERQREIQPAIEEAHRKKAEIEKEAQECREKFKNARDNVANLQKMINKKKNMEAKIRDNEKDLAVSNEEEKEQKAAELNRRIRYSLQALEAHSDSYKNMMKATIKYSGTRLNKEVATVLERKLRQELEDSMQEFDRLRREFDKVSAEFKQAKADTNKLKQVCFQEARLNDDEGNELPLKAVLDALPVETVEEAQVALEEAQNKVESIVADNNAIREFERNQTDIEDVQTQLDDLNSSEERRRAELEQKVKPWETSLEQAVSKIDALFSRYMGEMGCTGEVRLTKGGQSEELPYGNFKDWGVEIRVSFREGLNLQVLSARVQSGGERSVSTIMYLMALQGMMVSPFRCVDEINQGLDERNERLVFKRIVANSTQPPGPEGPTDHSGQYFLITPKLLPNLYDMEVEAMTVLFIFNGPYSVRDPKDWDVSRILSLRKRIVADAEACNDEENRGNGVPVEASPCKKRRLRIKAEVGVTREGEP